MSASILLTVPKYVAISPNPLRRISTSSPISPMSSDQMEDSGRGKKRRLDHLTWEEKIQRKKLKNRVAAQTSRDRKKAKMDEMESTIKTLTIQTDILRNKCDTLESINQSLLDKNSKLDRQVQELQQQIEELQRQQSLQNAAPPKTGCVGFGSNISLRSAEGNGTEVDPTRPQGEHPQGDPVEDSGALPSLQDLFEDFDAGKLEELAESLLADITSNLEGGDAAGCDDDAQSPGCGERLPGPVVGTTAEILESGENITGCVKIEPSTAVKSSSSSDPETLYGTYDEKTDSISIVLPGGNISINEAVEEIVSEQEQDPDPVIEAEDEFDPVKEFLCLNDDVNLSPKSPLSEGSTIDHGYESIGSPHSDRSSFQIDDFWSDKSFSELFPSLAC